MGNYLLDGTAGTNDPYPLDIDPPIFTESPIDITCDFGSTGNFIEWIAYDDHPQTYYIYKDFVQVETGNWYNMTPISINIDGLDIGTYTYLLTLFDTFGNFEMDAVEVTVETVGVIEFKQITYVIQVLIGLTIITLFIGKKKK